MKEIMDIMTEFKGKRVDNGKWVYGQLIKEINGDKMYAYILINPYSGGYKIDCKSYGCIEADEIIEVIPETVCKFTGLHDKNGNKIYKGDIVKAVDHKCPIESGVVVFKNGAFWIQGPISDNDLILLCKLNNHIAVVGNVYDIEDE